MQRSCPRARGAAPWRRSWRWFLFPSSSSCCPSRLICGTSARDRLLSRTRDLLYPPFDTCTIRLMWSILVTEATGLTRIVPRLEDTSVAENPRQVHASRSACHALQLIVRAAPAGRGCGRMLIAAALYALLRRG